MYKSLQSSRAIAALLVVFFHLGKAIADESYFDLEGFANSYLFGGVAGVDFFLVLSGFIIYYVHKKDFSQPGRLGNYLYKRVVRIYPSYLIIFLAVYISARLIPSFSESVPHDLWIVLKALSLLPLDPESVGGERAPVLIVAWSLQYEMFFYALFALAIFNLKLGAIGALTVLTANLILPSGDETPFPASFLGHQVILLFFMGIAAAQFCTRFTTTLGQTKLISIVGVLLFILAAIDFNLSKAVFSGYSNLVFGVASMLIIIALVTLEDHGFTFLGGRYFQLLGDASYALYLIHYPVISVMLKLLLVIRLDSLGLLGGVLGFLITLVVCLAASVLFHLYVEKPIANHLRMKR